mgnify:CR=1 FL=1
MNGSTETTFYVLAVYFGSVGVTRIRHGVAAGLTADVLKLDSCKAWAKAKAGSTRHPSLGSHRAVG